MDKLLRKSGGDLYQNEVQNTTNLPQNAIDLSGANMQQDRHSSAV